MKMTDKVRRMLAKGASTAEIAKKLKIRPAYVHTVKWLDKTGQVVSFGGSDDNSFLLRFHVIPENKKC